MQIINTVYKKGLVEIILSNGTVSPPILYSLFAASGFSKGDDISESELLNLYSVSEEKRAYNRAIYLVSKSDMSKGMLIEKLKKNFSDDFALAAANTIEEKGYINDGEYCKRLIKKMLLEGRSEKEIYEKLKQKKIPKDIIEEEFSVTDFPDYENCAELIRKKYAAKLLEENGRQKVISALMRRGYGFDDIKKALNNYCEEQDV